MDADRRHKIVAKGVEEIHRFLVMFAYLWLVFGLFVLNQAVILGKADINFLAQGFALINAAILAKVMLIAEDLKLGRHFDRYPMIYTIVFKACLFALVFIGFHILEEVVVAMFSGKTARAGLPAIGGGTWLGATCVWGIISVSLLPFFTLREIGMAMGEGQLWKLMVRRRETGS